MLRIRLSRVGRKHDPSYRVVVTEKSQPPQSGSYVEQVGTYNPKNDELQLRAERITHWISCGAQPSDTVHNLLVKTGVLDDDTVNPLPQKSPVIKEEPETQESEEKSVEDDDPEDSNEETEDNESTTTTKEDVAEDDEKEVEEENENSGQEDVETEDDNGDETEDD